MREKGGEFESPPQKTGITNKKFENCRQRCGFPKVCDVVATNCAICVICFGKGKLFEVMGDKRGYKYHSTVNNNWVRYKKYLISSKVIRILGTSRNDVREN